MLTLSPVGRNAHSILRDLDEAGIRYTRRLPKLGVIMNSGELVDFANYAKDNLPWAAIAYVLVAWIKARSSRKIVVTKEDGKIVHLEGLSATEVEQLLRASKDVVIMEANATPGEPKPGENEAIDE